MSQSGNNSFSQWVDDAKDPVMREFRQAVRTICAAISEMNDLGYEMLLKGGILLAIKYKSTRYTRDVDFSTIKTYASFDEEQFIRSLGKGLAEAVENLNYGLDCRIQKYEVEPPGEGKNFQTLKIRVGYAYNGSKKHLKLLKRQCPSALRVDYSFNELYKVIDTVEIDQNSSLKAYCLAEQVGEKYRAIIQQKSRNRFRGQDIYDINYLIENGYLSEESIKGDILVSLIKKATSRGIHVSFSSLDDPEIRRRTKTDYSTLKGEVEGELPDFDLCYDAVNAFYKALPWETVG